MVAAPRRPCAQSEPARGTAEWWAHEGRLCMEDERYGAAATAYTQAASLQTRPEALAAIIAMRDYCAYKAREDSNQW